MFENIRLSFQGIWSHKMRSFLTMLGIIIGIAAIIAIVSTIKGTNEQIKENLIGSGENTVEVSLYQGEWEYEMDYNGVPQGVPLVTDEVMSDIKDLDHVVNASAYLSRQDYSGVYHLNTAFSGGYVRGIDNSYFDTCNYIMKEGRAFTDEDSKKVSKFSLGMQKRLGIAQAIMEDPGILILDEATSALDEDGVKWFRSFMLEQKKKNKLIIISSHIREDIELLCDEVISLEHGRVVGHKSY